MKIEIISQTKDTSNGMECPTAIKITDDKGEVIQITVEDDSTYDFKYSPYLDIDHEKIKPETKQMKDKMNELVQSKKLFR